MEITAEHAKKMRCIMGKSRDCRFIDKDLRKLSLVQTLDTLRESNCSLFGSEVALRDRLLRLTILRRNVCTDSVPWYQWDDASSKGVVSKNVVNSETLKIWKRGCVKELSEEEEEEEASMGDLSSNEEEEMSRAPRRLRGAAAQWTLHVEQKLPDRATLGQHYWQKGVSAGANNEYQQVESYQCIVKKNGDTAILNKRLKTGGDIRNKVNRCDEPAVRDMSPRPLGLVNSTRACGEDKLSEGYGTETDERSLEGSLCSSMDKRTRHVGEEGVELSVQKKKENARRGGVQETESKMVKSSQVTATLRELARGAQNSERYEEDRKIRVERRDQGERRCSRDFCSDVESRCKEKRRRGDRSSSSESDLSFNISRNDRNRTSDKRDRVLRVSSLESCDRRDAAIKTLRHWELQFSGDEEKEDGEDFLMRLEACRENSSLVSDKQLLTALVGIFHKEASKWYTAKRPKIQSWRDFVHHFKRRFVKNYAREDLIDELRRRTQGKNEEITPYLTNFEFIASKVHPALSEKTLVDIAYKNLLPDYRRWMAHERLYSIDDIEDYGREWEREKEIDAKYQPPPTADNVCVASAAYYGSISKNAFHVATVTEAKVMLAQSRVGEKTKKNKSVIQNRASVSSSEESSSESVAGVASIDEKHLFFGKESYNKAQVSSTKQSLFRGACYECHEEGHPAFRCPNVVCAVCGNVGHYARECTYIDRQREQYYQRTGIPESTLSWRTTR